VGEAGTEYHLVFAVDGSIAKVSVQEDDRTEAANARLIAAAPEMREMIDRLLREWLTYTDFEKDARALLARIDGTPKEER